MGACPGSRGRARGHLRGPYVREPGVGAEREVRMETEVRAMRPWAEACGKLPEGGQGLEILPLEPPAPPTRTCDLQACGTVNLCF